MQVQSEDYAAENKHLRRCINDLLSVLALPALWSGSESAQIVRTLADTLVGMLDLDFVYVRLTDPASQDPLQLVRLSDPHAPKSQAQELSNWIQAWIAEDTQVWPRRMPDFAGNKEIAILPLRFGPHGGTGLIVVGAQRDGFPDPVETLILSVAMNQASVILQEGRLLSEQKQLADELDRRVAQRTAELAQANLELSREIAERKSAEDKLLRSEAFLAEGQVLSRTGSFAWRVETGEITWSEQLYRIFDIEPGTTVTIDLIATRIHPHDTQIFKYMIERVGAEAADLEFEHRLWLPDGSVKHLHLIAHANRDRDGELEYIGAVQDITQRRVSEEALANARSELAKVARMTSLGVLTAAMAHEVNQPLSGIMTNASTCLRMLSADPPNVDGARETARRTIRDGNRASDVITRLRTLYSKKDPTFEWMDLNEAAREVASLSLSELQRNRVILRQELAEDLPLVVGDRIQLQQVILNLLRNASDAMNTVDDRPRDMLITTRRDDEHRVCLSVKDSGIGFGSQAADQLFQAFYTTKNDGMGIGLSISRSIIEAHQGRLWATANDGAGATFSFMIPSRPDSAA